MHSEDILKELKLTRLKSEAVNLALGNGTPIEIMDRTFATVVYALHYIVSNDFSGVIPLPEEIDKKISRLVLKIFSKC